jgi:hypothetical protein
LPDVNSVNGGDGNASSGNQNGGGSGSHVPDVVNVGVDGEGTSFDHNN